MFFLIYAFENIKEVRKTLNHLDFTTCEISFEEANIIARIKEDEDKAKELLEKIKAIKGVGDVMLIQKRIHFD